MAEHDDSKKTTETWTYIGQRVQRNGSKWEAVAAWLDETGEQRLFDSKSTTRGTQPGARHSMTVEHKDDGQVVASFGTIRYVGMEGNDDKRLEWAAEDRAAATVMEQQRQSKKTRNDLTEACAPLRDRYTKLFGSARKAAFLAALIEEITR